MSKFPTNLPLKVQPPRFEQSNLVPMRDSTSPYGIWKDVRNHATAINSIIETIGSLYRDVTMLQQSAAPDFKFYPFKLYNLTKDFRPDIENKTWRTFTVRAGNVLTKYVDSRSMVQGTDDVTYTDYNFIPSPVSHGSFEVPISSSNFWVWIHVLTGSAITGSSGSNEQYIVHYGDKNPATNYTSSGKSVGSQSYAWDNFPSSSTQNIPIGYIDTATSGAMGRALVRQYLRSDVLNVGASSGSFIPVNVCINGVDTTLFINGFFASGSGG